MICDPIRPIGRVLQRAHAEAMSVLGPLVLLPERAATAAHARAMSVAGPLVSLPTRAATAAMTRWRTKETDRMTADVLARRGDGV